MLLSPTWRAHVSRDNISPSTSHPPAAMSISNQPTQINRFSAETLDGFLCRGNIGGAAKKHHGQGCGVVQRPMTGESLCFQFFLHRANIGCVLQSLKHTHGASDKPHILHHDITTSGKPSYCHFQPNLADAHERFGYQNSGCVGLLGRENIRAWAWPVVGLVLV